MKILLHFINHDNKSDIITPFIGMENCQANEKELIIPGVIKIDYSDSYIKCFCFSLDVANKILSNICEINVDSSNNIGFILFPKSLFSVTLESKLLDFNNILELVSNGKVHYINTNDKMLKANIVLSQWLSADLLIDDYKSYINLKFNNYEINVSDNSAMQFCTRVKENPLMVVSSLSNYFDFGSEMKIKPVIDYICFWKVLKSENGYKRYSNFINDCNDKVNIIYDEGKRYRCEFEGGRIDFQLLSVGDKYPKKVILQIEDIKDTFILESLKKNLNLNTIELIAKISNLKLNTFTLLDDLGFYKDDNFFIFTNSHKEFKANYDIGSSTLTIRQEIKLSNEIDKDSLNNKVKHMKEWVNYLIEISN